MATLKYFTRTKKQSGNLTPVYCRLRSGRVIDLTAKSGVSVQPDHFSNLKGAIKPNADFKGVDHTRKDLKDLKDHIFAELAIVKDKPSKDWLQLTIDKYHNPEKYKPKVYDLFSYIENFIETTKNRTNRQTGRPISYMLIKTYERVFYFLKEFADEQGKPVDFEDINIGFYDEFMAFLQKKKLALNSVGRIIQVLKTFLNAATDEGYNTNLQYKNKRFTTVREDSESIYLTEDEIQQIYKLDLSDNLELDRIRDLFVIGCWIGQRYSDWNKVTQNNIKGDFLEIKQQKTGQSVVIPLHSTVKLILAKYEGILPPVPYNNDVNAGLKKIAAIAKLNEPTHKAITKGGKTISKKYPKWQLVTTHAARRSFATNLYNRGLDTYTIKQITGHKTEASFLQYIRVTPTEYAEKLRQFWSTPAPLKVVRS